MISKKIISIILLLGLLSLGSIFVYIIIKNHKQTPFQSNNQFLKQKQQKNPIHQYSNELAKKIKRIDDIQESSQRNKILEEIISELKNNQDLFENQEVQETVIFLISSINIEDTEEKYLKVFELAGLFINSSKTNEQTKQSLYDISTGLANTLGKYKEEQVQFGINLLKYNLLNDRGLNYFFYGSFQEFLQEKQFDLKSIEKFFIPMFESIEKNPKNLKQYNYYFIRYIKSFFERGYIFKEFPKMEDINFKKRQRGEDLFAYSLMFKFEELKHFNYIQRIGNPQLYQKIYQILDEILFKIITNVDRELKEKFDYIKLQEFFEKGKLNGELLIENLKRLVDIFSKFYQQKSDTLLFYSYPLLFEHIFKNFDKLSKFYQSTATDKFKDTFYFIVENNKNLDIQIYLKWLFIFLIRYHKWFDYQTINNCLSLLETTFEREKIQRAKCKISKDYNQMDQYVQQTKEQVLVNNEVFLYGIPHVFIISEIFTSGPKLVEQVQNDIIQQIIFYMEDFENAYFNLKSQYAYLFIKMEENKEKAKITFSSQNYEKILEKQEMTYRFREKIEYKDKKDLESDEEVDQFKRDMALLKELMFGDPNYISLENNQKLKNYWKNKFVQKLYQKIASVEISLFENYQQFCYSVKFLNLNQDYKSYSDEKFMKYLKQTCEGIRKYEKMLIEKS